MMCFKIWRDRWCVSYRKRILWWRVRTPKTSADNEYKTRVLQTAASDPLLKSRLHYLGFRADSERVIAAADVVVCSSHFESYGMVNMEMASGKPVVSTNKGGPSETVADGVTGYLVPPGDAAGLAVHVIALLENVALRRDGLADARSRNCSP